MGLLGLVVLMFDSSLFDLGENLGFWFFRFGGFVFRDVVV